MCCPHYSQHPAQLLPAACDCSGLGVALRLPLLPGLPGTVATDVVAEGGNAASPLDLPLDWINFKSAQ